MTDQLNNIIFWISFVGVAIFIVNSVHATIVLHLSKSKDFKPPDVMMTAVSLTLAIIFTALAISNNLRLNKPNNPTPIQSNTYMEFHKKTGEFIEWNEKTKKYDTIEIYRKK